MEQEKANIQEEKYLVKFTEWELDTLIKAIRACSFPGTHIDVVASLQKKLTEVSDVDKK